MKAPLGDVVKMALGIALGNTLSEILVPDEALMVDPFFLVPGLDATLLVRSKQVVAVDGSQGVYLKDGTVIYCGKPSANAT